MWEPHFKDTFKRYCVQCHGSVPSIPDFSKIYEEVKKVTKINKGASIQTLTRSSHIHLFGISCIFFFVGFIFSFTVDVPRWLKISAIAIPFGFLIVDVFSWWLTRWNPNFAWLTLIGGFGYSVTSTIMWLIRM